MKVEVESVASISDELAVIKAFKMTDDLKTAIELLESCKHTISCYKDNEKYLIDVSKIYYIESVDNRTFVFLKNETYETRLKLYELLDVLDKSKFFRASKSMILNVKKIHHVKSSLNGRISATLLNEEAVVISRSYAKDLKNLLGV